MKIYPEGQTPQVDSNPLEITKAKRTAMIKKAKELLTEPMSADTLKTVLEYFFVYGRMPEKVDGKFNTTGSNIPVEEGHESKHYTSAQLKEVVDQVAVDLKPVVEEITP